MTLKRRPIYRLRLRSWSPSFSELVRRYVILHLEPDESFELIVEPEMVVVGSFTT